MSRFLTQKARKLAPYVAGLQPKESMIKLNTNENPYPPSPKVENAIKNADISRLSLYPNCESTQLCEAIASNFGIPSSKIFCTNSSDEVLDLAFAAFLAGKTNVLMPEISYGFYPVWAEKYDVAATPIPLNADFSINPNAYKGGNGVVIANPNAPTSLALNLADIEQIIINNPNGIVIIDEAYIDFAAIESAIKLVGKYDNLLVTRTFSKSYSLAGLRVGIGIGNEELIAGLNRMKNALNPYALDMLAQIGATAAIKDSECLRETCEKIKTTRTKTTQELRKLGFEILESQANFIFMKCENGAELYEYLYAHKILTRRWNTPKIHDFLRITIGTDQQMEEVVSCVKQYLLEKQQKQMLN